MTEELTEEQKQAENDRLDALEAKREKNIARAKKAAPKKAVRKKAAAKSSIEGDMIVCITKKKIARPGSATEMCEIGEEVSLSRENAIILQDANAIKIKL